MTDKELLGLAREASKKAYVPYSKFAVGAALECRGGQVFTGCNVENAALGDTICAERTACVKAVSEGYCMPCGSCRQFLSEFDPHGDIEVLASRADGRYVSYRLRELMPHTFNY